LVGEQKLVKKINRAGFGFCRGKKYFCRESGKTGKNRGKKRQNWQ